MIGPVIRFVAILSICFGLSSQALAAKRIALVIGNDAYTHLPATEQLKNAINDAKAVRAALKSLDFEVLYGENLSRDAFIDKFFDFTSRISNGDISLFFYAGHGVGIEGGNYFLPSDMRPPQSSRRQEGSRIIAKSVGELFVLNGMKEAGAGVAIAVLDSCRNNPLASPDGRSLGSARGFTRIAPPTGVFSIYSAGFNQRALDRLPHERDDVNSVFTRVFVKNILRPGLSLYDMARQTRAHVVDLAASIGHEQVPAIYDQIVGSPVYLAGREKIAPTASDTPSGGALVDDRSIEVTYWESVKDSQSAELFRSYLRKFPQGVFAEIAKLKLKSLKVSKKAALQQPGLSEAAPLQRGPWKPAPRGWLGVKVQTMTAEVAQSLGLDKPQGVIVAEASNDGPAHIAGLQIRDVILEIDGKPTDSFRQLLALIYYSAPGSNVVVKIKRDGEVKLVNVKLGRLKVDPIQVSMDGVKAGNVDAMINLARKYITSPYIGPDVSKALGLLRQVSGKDQARGNAALGDFYMIWNARQRDPERAVKHYRLAAEYSHVEAMGALGFMYEHGLGTTKKPDNAAKWYTAYLGANTGKHKAYVSFRLGKLQFEGDGIPQDRVSAATHILEALRGKSLDAKAFLLRNAETAGTDFLSALQQAMKAKGDYKHKIDGRYGPGTKTALLAYVNSYCRVRVRKVPDGSPFESFFNDFFDNKSCRRSYSSNVPFKTVTWNFPTDKLSKVASVAHDMFPAPEKSEVILGMTLAAMTPKLRGKYGIVTDVMGVVVTDVSKDSTAASKNIKPGDVIMEIAQEAIREPRELVRRVESLSRSGRASILILASNNKGDLRFLNLKLGQ